MSPAHTRRNGKLYHYCVSTDVLKRDAASCPIHRVPAAQIERAVIDQLRGLLRAPEIVVRTWRAARAQAEVRQALVIRSGMSSSPPSRHASFSSSSSESRSIRT